MFLYFSRITVIKYFIFSVMNEVLLDLPLKNNLINQIRPKAVGKECQ